MKIIRDGITIVRTYYGEPESLTAFEEKVWLMAETNNTPVVAKLIGKSERTVSAAWTRAEDKKRYASFFEDRKASGKPLFEEWPAFEQGNA